MDKIVEYIDINKPEASQLFTASLYRCIRNVAEEKAAAVEKGTSFFPGRNQPIVFICIGTDRSTGDSLGPLVGYKLSAYRYFNTFIIGTLSQPIHAKNLEEKLNEVSRMFSNPLIIAVDACLGTMEHVGNVIVANEGLKPGSGVKKELPVVGDISIKGVVNFGGFMEFMVLQNTRLDIVMRMADLISVGIDSTLRKLSRTEAKFGSGMIPGQEARDRMEIPGFLTPVPYPEA